MVLALIVYTLIYAALLGYLKYSSRDVRDFCDGLETGLALNAVQSQAESQGFVSAINKLSDSQEQILFISSPENHEATCQCMMKDGKLSDKKFVLSVF